MRQGELFHDGQVEAHAVHAGLPPSRASDPPFLFDGLHANGVVGASDEAPIERIRRISDAGLAALIRAFEGERRALGASERLLLYFRAATHASARGACWTPALDALACSWYWPVGDGLVHRFGRTYRVSASPPEAWTAGLRPWIAKQTGPAQLFRLIRFGWERVRAEVARHVRCADVGLVLTLASEPDLMLDLAHNPALREAELDVLRDAILDRIRVTASARSTELAALVALQQRGHALEPREFDEVYALVRDDEKVRSRECLRTLSQFHLPWRPTRRR